MLSPDVMEIDDLRSEVIAHPWRSVAIALLAGAVYAAGRQTRGTLVGAVGAVAASALSAVRTAANDRAGSLARSWIDQRFTRGSMPAAPRG